MRFGFHIVSKQQFDVYRELQLTDVMQAERLRQEEWVVPKTRKNDWSCSLSRCMADDYAGYRDQLPQACRELLDEFLKRTIFSCWRNDGFQTADLAINGLEFCGAISSERAAQLVSTYRAIDLEQVRRCYRSGRDIEYELFVHVMESWSQLLESVRVSGQYLIIVTG